MHWSLLDEDLAIILIARGDANRIGAAADLCSLRSTGTFVGRWSLVPLVVVNYLARQLDLPPVVSLVPEPERRATVTAARERLRRYLGYRTFGDEELDVLTDELRARFELDADEGNLLDAAVAMLMSWRVVRPGPSTLGRLVAQVIREVTATICERMTASVSAEHAERLDALIAPVGKGATTSLDQLKRTQSGPQNKAFARCLDLLEQLEPLLPTATAASVVSLPWQRRLCAFARQHEASALRRLDPTQRRAVVACFVAHSHRELLDEIVELNSALVATVCSNAKKAARTVTREAREATAHRLGVAADALERLMTADDANIALAELRQDPGTVRGSHRRLSRRRQPNSRRLHPGIAATVCDDPPLRAAFPSSSASS